MSAPNTCETDAENYAHDAAAGLHREMTSLLCEEVGMTDLEASKLAEAVSRGLRKRFPGSYLGEFYLSSRLSVRERAARDRAVRREFNGTNAEEVCARHKIGRSMLYRIIGRR